MASAATISLEPPNHITASSPAQLYNETIEPHPAEAHGLATQGGGNSSTNSPVTPPPIPSSINPKSRDMTSSRFSQWTTKWITDWWGVELICWTISTISVIAIVIVLESHKNKPLPEWPFKLTINSLISIFATIGQMAMMKPVVECINFQALDDASRGPTGSLMFLGKLRGIHLITLGAAITVYSVAFGAFAQQVVTYPLRPHTAGNAATPLVLNLTGPSNIQLLLDGSVSASMSAGLSSNGSSLSNVTPSCSTGDCTWNTYPSLAVCVSTVDMSSNISKNACGPMELDGFFQKAGLENPGYPCFNYSLPVLGYETVISGESYSTEFETVNLSNVASFASSGMGYMISSPSVGSSNYSFINGYIMYQPDIETSINSSLASPVAYGFSFDLCVQTYITIVTNGSTSTHVTSSRLFDSEVSEEPADKDGVSMALDIHGKETANLSVGDVNFGVVETGFAAIAVEMLGFFVESCYYEINDTDGFPPVYCTNPSNFGLTWLQNFNSSDLFNTTDTLMQNIATSMTNALRTGAGGNTQITQFQRTVFVLQLYIGTNYNWLTLPISLVSLILVFLIAPITKNQ